MLLFYNDLFSYFLKYYILLTVLNLTDVQKDFFDLEISLFIKNDFRRSLFNNAERGKFLNQLVAGVRKILLNPQVTKIQWLPEKKKNL